MGRQGEKRNGWSDIQQELLEEILRKLTLVDYLKCGRVCWSWRHIVKDAIPTKGRTCPPAPQFPFLMLLPLNFDTNKPGALFDITQDTPSTISTKTWKGYSDFNKVFSVQGWLVFQKIYYENTQNYDQILFSYPVSGEEFELPHLPLFPGHNFTHHITVKLIFSSASPDSPDFLVVACAGVHTLESRYMQLLAFCKVADKKWNLIPTHQYQPSPFDMFIIVDQKLYELSHLADSVTLYNLRDSNMISIQKLKLEPIPKREPCFTKTCLFARDGDDIWLVVPRMELCQVFSRNGQLTEIKGFRVFKLDMCSSTKWIEVDDLGDRVLLMDSAGIQVISAKEIKLPAKFSGGNCVVFCVGKYLEVHDDVGVFNFFVRVFTLKDKTITHFPLNYRPLKKPFSYRFLWFMPSPW